MASDKTDTIKKAMLESLEKSRGIVSVAANNAGISRDTHYRWLKEDEAYANTVDWINEAAIDHVESKLFEKIDGVAIQKQTPKGPVIYDQPPSDTAIIFFLKTRGKKRGYVERTEIDANVKQHNPASISFTDRDE